MKSLLIPVLIIFFLNPVLGQRNDNPESYLRIKKKKINAILKAGDFKPGEKVADIGAGDGWLAAAIGIYVDSLSFYLEDIDSTFSVNGRLNEALASYEKVKGSPITCSYIYVTGTKKTTNLTNAYFDKVLIVDTYHHFDHPIEMISDINRILKPGGKLIIYEPLARKPGDIYKPCKKMLYTMSQIISTFQEYGFRHEATGKTVNSSGKKVRVFVFVRN